MATVTITVREIHCAAFENTIRTALSRLEGVRSVRPDQRTSQVRISYDETAVGEDKLRTRLADLGYDPVD
jgi:copper chaperone CopZ